MKNDGVAKRNGLKRIPVRFLDTQPTATVIPVVYGMGVRAAIIPLKQFRLVITATNTAL